MHTLVHASYETVTRGQTRRVTVHGYLVNGKIRVESPRELQGRVIRISDKKVRGVSPVRPSDGGCYLACGSAEADQPWIMTASETRRRRRQQSKAKTAKKPPQAQPEPEAKPEAKPEALAKPEAKPEAPITKETKMSTTESITTPVIACREIRRGPKGKGKLEMYLKAEWSLFNGHMGRLSTDTYGVRPSESVSLPAFGPKLVPSFEFSEVPDTSQPLALATVTLFDQDGLRDNGPIARAFHGIAQDAVGRLDMTQILPGQAIALDLLRRILRPSRVDRLIKAILGDDVLGQWLIAIDESTEARSVILGPQNALAPVKPRHEAYLDLFYGAGHDSSKST